MSRVLVIANNALRKSNSNGSTLINHLSSFSIDEIITFSIDSALPDKDTALAHYKTTDKEHLKYFFKKKNLGRVIKNEELVANNDIPVAVGKHKSIKESALGHYIREFIWKHGKWNKEGLYNFIEEYKPTVILYMCGRSTFMNNITLDIHNRFNIPIVIYTSEDEYFHKYSLYRVIKNSLQRKLIKSYKALLKETKTVICQHDKLNRLFKEEFNVETITSMPSCSIAPSIEPIVNNDGPIMYIGNINPNRYSSLIDVSLTLSKIDKNLKLHIYSGDMTTTVRKKLSKYPNIDIKDPVSKAEVPNLMKEARLLIHVESFKKKDKVLIENAFSTKIPDSLASGVPFILYGPNYCGFVEYFNKNNTPIKYVDSIDSLEKVLDKSLNNKEYIKELTKSELLMAVNNHNKEINSKRIYNTLVAS